MTSQLRRYILLTIFVGIHGIAGAQEAAEPMKVYMDYARFRGDDQNIFVEFYYSIPQRSLSYVRDSAGLKAGADVTLTIAKGDSTVYADRWVVPHVVADEQAIARSINLVGATGLMLRAGEYHARMVGRDLNNPARVDSVALRLPVTMIDKTKLMLSDIELAASIRQGGEGGQFHKNTLEVIPNVEAMFGETQKCFLYAEVYNILATDERSDYHLRLKVFDAIGREVISREKPRKRLGESSVIVDNIVTTALKTGTYTVVLSLHDSSGTLQSSSGRKFFVYNQTLGIDSTMLGLQSLAATGIFAGMGEDELDREFAWVKYEITDAEKTQYEGLNGADAKRKFLADFWRRRPDGYRKEYLDRVAFANRTYQNMGRAGYLSDRGRVHIMYGSPDDIDRHPNEADARPYEVWSYNNIQGGVIFVFLLRQAGSEYDLVHSTHRNELSDENWARILLQR